MSKASRMTRVRATVYGDKLRFCPKGIVSRQIILPAFTG
jgi:hypothetical protein